jgi:hypoxanthine phosphoribosyltransferase
MEGAAACTTKSGVSEPNAAPGRPDSLVKKNKVRMQDYKEVLSEILIDEPALQARIAELGREISRDYAGMNLLLICILRGGVPFLVDLSRHITIPHMVDFMAVSSYGVGKRQSTGFARVSLDLQTDIRGKDVLLVEDIVTADTRSPLSSTC